MASGNSDALAGRQGARRPPRGRARPRVRCRAATAGSTHGTDTIAARWSARGYDAGSFRGRSRKSETRLGTRKGKVSYMSPEQCQAQALDRRSDLFSLGVVLYELTTQRKLFAGESDHEVMRRIVLEPAPSPVAVSPDYPEELARIVRHALERDPERRYATAEQVQLDLEAFCARQGLMLSTTRLARYMESLFDAEIAAWRQAQRGGSRLTAAQLRLERGLEAYRDRRYDEAIREFLAGFEADPQPEFLYALGQAARAKGDCARAGEYFRAFLATLPTPRQVEATQVQLARCGHERGAQPASSASMPSSAPAVVATVSAPAARAVPPRARAARARVRLAACGGVDIVSRQGIAELAATYVLARWLDVGAAASLGRHVGGRLVLGLHPDRGRGWRLKPAFEVRGVAHPVAGEVALGGGLWLGASLEVGPGRLRAGMTGEIYHAPTGYYPYAVLATGGYELDL